MDREEVKRPGLDRGGGGGVGGGGGGAGRGAEGSTDTRETVRYRGRYNQVLAVKQHRNNYFTYYFYKLGTVSFCLLAIKYI